MKRALSSLLLLSAVLWAQKAAAPVPVDKEPMHHLFLENSYVKVYKVEVPPGGRTQLHQHDRDYLFVILGDADITNARQGAQPVQMKPKDGDVAYAKGGFAHVAINNAQTPFRNVTIEIMKDKPDPNARPSQQIVGAGMSSTWMVDNERAHAEVIELEPGAAQPVHDHTIPHLIIFLTDGKMQNEITGKEKKSVFPVERGEVEWAAETGFTHALRNVGTKPVRWVMVEVK